MSDLRKCPFCCGEASLGEGHSGGSTGNEKYIFVNCVECLMSNDMIANMQEFDEEMAIEHWNNRSNAMVALPSASDNTRSDEIALIESCIKVLRKYMSEEYAIVYEKVLNERIAQLRTVR